MKPGDTVRFLNRTGGGVVARIEGRMAYVEDADGFEQPMALNECVVVPTGKPDMMSDKSDRSDRSDKSDLSVKPQKPAVRQTAKGFNIAMLFEPDDIRRLSQARFDVYLVNDTNYTLQFTVATRDRLDGEWTLFAAGEAEPCTQAWLGEALHTELNRFENIAVQAVAYKTDAPFALMPPAAMEVRFDVTRLAKLHCFTPTAYSTVPVVTLPVVTNGNIHHPLDASALVEHFEPKDETPAAAARNRRNAKTGVKDPKEPEVIDLHASELLDTTAGLGPGEILALQLDVFERTMREAEKTPGKRLIFIHGKGEGVLRHALLDRLRRRWPRCEAQDASFREYGFGATQITIHK